MEIKFFDSMIGLGILIAINILLGTLDALIDKKFDLKKALIGVTKAVTVIGCLYAIFYAASLNLDIVVIEMNETPLNLMTAVNLLVITGYVHYAKDALNKIKAMLTVESWFPKSSGENNPATGEDNSAK